MIWSALRTIHGFLNFNRQLRKHGNIRAGFGWGRAAQMSWSWLTHVHCTVACIKECATKLSKSFSKICQNFKIWKVSLEINVSITPPVSVNGSISLSGIEIEALSSPQCKTPFRYLVQFFLRTNIFLKFTCTILSIRNVKKVSKHNSGNAYPCWHLW